MTIDHWQRRFQTNRAEIAELYDERFCRMWEFYLTGSEIAFRFEGHAVAQIQLARRQDTVPMTRRYIESAEDPRRWLKAGE
jgi:cyclopropane-fatty-acyl-phospholipid synthase